MHAVIVYSTIDMTRMDEAVGGIDTVKQRLMGIPGFKDAYWFEPIDGAGMSISIWEDETAASSAAPPVGFEPAPGVTIQRVEVREVIGQV